MFKRKTLLYVSMMLLFVLTLVGCKSNNNTTDEAYRIIQVVETNGNVQVDREGVGSLQAYPQMKLQNKDRITVDANSYARLSLDDDKYVYVESDTVFVLEATGTQNRSYTNIKLEKGAITNEIQKPLSNSSEYKIETPNSTMSVRGTVYYVNVDVQDEVSYTTVKVFDGKVETKLFHEDGSETEPVLVESGKGVLVHGDIDLREYVVSDIGEIQTEIKLEELSDETLEVLYEISTEDDRLFTPNVDIKEEIDSRKKTDDVVQTDPIPTRYSLKFYSNNTLLNEQSLYEDETITYPQSQRSGYTLAGWYTEPTYKNEYKSKEMPKQNMNLYAKWVANDVTLSLNDGNSTSKVTQKADSSLELPTPTKEGYTFEGWYNGDEKFTQTIMPTKDTSLEARWSANDITLTLNNEGSQISMTQKADSTLVLPTPTKEGYIFEGWYNGDEKFTQTTMPTKDTSLEAKWNARTDISYNIEVYKQKNNSSEYELVDTKSYYDGTMDSQKTVYADLIDGYQFNSTSSKTQMKLGSQNNVFKIYYDRIYTVTFKDENNNVLEVKNSLFNGILELPSISPITGYNSCWNDGVNDINPGTEVTVVSDLVFTTKYTIIQCYYKINYVYANAVAPCADYGTVYPIIKTVDGYGNYGTKPVISSDVIITDDHIAYYPQVNMDNIAVMTALQNEYFIYCEKGITVKFVYNDSENTIDYKYTRYDAPLTQNDDLIKVSQQDLSDAKSSYIQWYTVDENSVKNYVSTSQNSYTIDTTYYGEKRDRYTIKYYLEDENAQNSYNLVDYSSITYLSETDNLTNVADYNIDSVKYNVSDRIVEKDTSNKCIEVKYPLKKVNITFNGLNAEPITIEVKYGTTFGDARQQIPNTLNNNVSRIFWFFSNDENAQNIVDNYRVYNDLNVFGKQLEIVHYYLVIYYQNSSGNYSYHETKEFEGYSNLQVAINDLDIDSQITDNGINYSLKGYYTTSNQNIESGSQENQNLNVFQQIFNHIIEIITGQSNAFYALYDIDNSNN